MRKNLEPSSWQTNLAEFGVRNKMRPTRLEVLGPTREVESDFWIEDGLLLSGIDVEMDGHHGPSVEIMLESQAVPGHDHMTHTVTGVKRVELDATDGRDDVLEIED